MAEIDDRLYDDLLEWVSENEIALLTEFDEDERLNRILATFGTILKLPEEEMRRK
ncbi:MAG TPA: hypothetical protein VJ044_02740 [Candidatus Hodarchaeales archaeon]|nr:hypothetical protein [Candidatus Hodarchaeales archaeon]